MKKEDIKAGEVYYTSNYDVLRDVINKTDEIKKNDMSKEEFALRIGKYLVNRTGIVLVSFGEDKELNGCHVISKQRDKFGEYLWIDFSWIDPHCPDLRGIFYKEIIDQCKARGIKRIQMRMSKGFKAMERLFGTYEIGRILEKKVILNE